jgi:multimeric flavodoxin WrbA
MISGSPRKNGNSMELLGVCGEVFRREGLEYEIITLAGRKIESCSACGQCSKTGRCSIDDGTNEIIDSLRESEGFIVASPVYFGTARGDLMALLQRIGRVSRAGDRFLSRKVGGPIAVARRGGHTFTLQEMLMFFLISDMIVPGSTYWNMVFAAGIGEVKDDKEGVETIRRFAENVAFLIKKLGD